MAVKNQANQKNPNLPKMMRDFWPKYRRSVVFYTIIMQFIVMAIVAISLIIADVPIDSLGFWVTTTATFLVASILNLTLIIQFLIPLRDLTNSISSASGEKPRFPIANPNTPRYANNSFREILQFIYDSAAGQTTVSNNGDNSDQSSLILDALNVSRNGLVIMNGDGHILYASQAAPVVKNSDGEQAIELLFEPESSFYEWLENCRETAVHAERTWLRVPNRVMGDESRRIFNISASYEKGSNAEVVLTAFDATDTYQPEDTELDFIAFAAHELRGPITVIRGYLDVLDIELGDKMAPDQRELMKRLIVSANRLTGYINNILNTSKYDRRHLKLHLLEDTMANVYASIADDMTLRASSQNRLLSVNIPNDLPTVAVDRSSMGEVLGNLIDNAIKYSNEGGSISVTASATTDFVTISVKDNGIGMPSNVVGNLFHKFYRSHRSRETVAGTGIGLYICKAIVESHGGKIEVVSTDGQGSTFSFSVPVFASVADKLLESGYSNTGLITSNQGWIQNHAKFKG